MASVKKELTKGVFWIAVAKYSGIVIQLLISAILARKIAPAAFGTIAVAMVVMYFLDILADIGIGPAVVQYKQLTKAHLNSLFTLTVYLGVFLSVVLYMLSGVIAGYYADTMLERICQIERYFNERLLIPEWIYDTDIFGVYYLSELIQGRNIEAQWEEHYFNVIVNASSRDKLLRIDNKELSLSFIGNVTITLFKKQYHIKIIRLLKSALPKDVERFRKKVEYADDGETVKLVYVAGSTNDFVDKIAPEDMEIGNIYSLE